VGRHTLVRKVISTETTVKEHHSISAMEEQPPEHQYPCHQSTYVGCIIKEGNILSFVPTT
jgi:hypothetical protein